MKNWGDDLIIITIVDAGFLPGAYGLFNSLLLNGFKGKFRIVRSKDFDLSLLPAHPQLTTDKLVALEGNYHHNVHRFNYFSQLSEGNYLFLDADVIIERPLDLIVENLREELLFSAEEEPKYSSFDVFFKRQARQCGFATTTTLREIGYINGGLIGFSLPAHQRFVDLLIAKSKSCLENVLEYTKDPKWYFIDQDMLNVVARCCDLPLSVISSRQIEIGVAKQKWLQDRPFPAQKQTPLHYDQVKFIIHGAALRRPWINPYPNTKWGKAKRALYEWGINGMVRKPTPYERAWAYYACREDRPIPVSHWAAGFSFRNHKNSFWQKAHGLDA